MSKWIDAEWLSKLFPDTGDGDWTYNATALGYINSAPSIDIVRCKECIHRKEYQCAELEFYECRQISYHGTKIGVTDDWFCANGERKESE